MAYKLASQAFQLFKSMVQAFIPETCFAVQKALKCACRIPAHGILFDEIPDQFQIYIRILKIEPIK